MKKLTLLVALAATVLLPQPIWAEDIDTLANAEQTADEPHISSPEAVEIRQEITLQEDKKSKAQQALAPGQKTNRDIRNAEGRIAILQSRLAGLGYRVGRVEKRVGNVDRRVTTLEKSVRADHVVLVGKDGKGGLRKQVADQATQLQAAEAGIADQGKRLKQNEEHVSNLLDAVGKNEEGGLLYDVIALKKSIAGAASQALAWLGVIFGAAALAVATYTLIRVIRGGTASGSATPLTLTGCTPTGAAGNTITLTGDGFESRAKVKIGGKNARVKFVSATELEVTVPSGLTAGTPVDVEVTSKRKAAKLTGVFTPA